MLRNGASGDWIGTFQGHKGAVWSCVLNETALVAATASADFSAKVWNALTGDETHSFQHKHICRTLAFAKSTPRLLTAGHEKLVRIFDLEKPDTEPEVLQEAPDKVRGVAFLQDDKLLLTSYIDKPGIGVWDMRSKAIVRTMQTDKIVTSIEVMPDSSYVVTADGTEVKFWDGASLGMKKAYSQAYSVESATFCPEKGRFVVGGEDMWVHLHDYATGEEVECNKGHHGPVHTVRFAPGGQSYASGSEDGTIRIWETDFAANQANSPSRQQNGHSKP
jgi:serine-threonine kinase receptor-associated protein